MVGNDNDKVPTFKLGESPFYAPNPSNHILDAESPKYNP